MALCKSPDDRWAWVEIDTAALRRNTKTLKGLLGPRTKMMCSVKADAYGHGATECARIMRAAGADQFAVATVAEGIELRESGLTVPILILNEPPIDSIPLVVEHNLMPSIYTTEFALAYGECAAAANKIGKYHVPVDTGMTRIGLLPRDVVDFRRAVSFHRGLECAGTFTHFATAENVDDWDFSLQLKRFMQVINDLRQENLDPGLVHCDNTPGTIMHPEAQFDMCRLGIGLYGLHPAQSTRTRVELEPVMSVRGRITRVVYPEVGDGVGYGMTYRVPRRNIQVATVPMGYADGLARPLSNNMDVLVNGMRCRQVGNICMDQFMFAVDVNPTRAYKPTKPVAYGDVVTVMGVDGDEAITADELADIRGTINYEVTCDFGLRMEKVYV